MLTWMVLWVGKGDGGVKWTQLKVIQASSTDILIVIVSISVDDDSSMRGFEWNKEM